METQIERLLELYSLEEALESMDMTPEECLRILLEGGYVELPPFLLTPTDSDEYDDDK